MGKYIELNQKQIWKETIKEGVVLGRLLGTLVWTLQNALLLQLINQHKSLEGKQKFVEVNTEEEPDLTAKYEIRSIPTILYFKDGKIVDQTIGATTKAKIEEKIK